MIRSFRYTILFICCMLTLASPTCVDDVPSGGEAWPDQDVLQAVTGDLSTGSITGKNIEAFEYRAVEKLMDYADYLSILYNQELDSVFREQAAKNIKDLFSDGSPAEHPLPSGIDPGSYRSVSFLVDSVEIIIPLSEQPDETYTGSLQYSLKISGITGSDTLALDSSTRRMGILLEMRSKDFGEDSMLVREVLLDDR